MCQAPTTQTWQVDTFLAYISNEELDTFILLDTFISLLSYDYKAIVNGNNDSQK